ncbi:hypothetical protein RI367_003351 [Sorochytrium milnesiophthora]
MLFAVQAFAVSAATLPQAVSGDSAEKPTFSPLLQVIGRFEELKALRHPNLCMYIDVVPGGYDRERVFTVQEHGATTLDQLPLSARRDALFLRDVLIGGVLDALVYLHDRYIVHRNWSLSNIVICPSQDDQRQVKLSGYGLYSVTACGSLVSFPIGSQEQYWSPEIVQASPEHQSGPRSDIWALGVLIFECWMGRPPFTAFTSRNVNDVYDNLYALTQLQHALSNQRINDLVAEAKMPVELQAFVLACLTPDVAHRPTARQLQQHAYLANRSRATLANGDPLPDDPDLASEAPEEHTLAPDEVYYLWRTAGADVEVEFGRRQEQRSHAPVAPFFLPAILRTPQFISPAAGGLVIESEHARASHRLLRTVILDLEDTMKRIQAAVPKHGTGPAHDKLRISTNAKEGDAFKQAIMKCKMDVAALSKPTHLDTQTADDDQLQLFPLSQQAHQQPLAIRTRDLDYQLERLTVFRTLLTQYPASRRELIAHARIDVLPLCRGKIWAALLGVMINRDNPEYDRWDGAPASEETIHQVEVDIRRCHSYHPLLSSPHGQAKLKRIILAWLTANAPHYVYWQGFDSVCAPFVTLLFNDEPAAFACVQRFTERYLAGFFSSGERSLTIQAHLVTFKRLLSYHDPLLSAHLDRVGLHPDLYALAWFLTAFAHVLPLHTLYQVWDRVLVAPPSLPLYIGVAILRACRETLLALPSFDDCVTFFGEFPDVDMEMCVSQAEDLCSMTLPSLEQAQPLATSAPDQLGSWWEAAMPLEQMKQELTPRLSLTDFAQLITQPGLLVVDCRAPQDFNTVHLVGSFNAQASNIALSAPYLQKHGKTSEYVVVLADNREAGIQASAHRILLQLLHN